MEYKNKSEMLERKFSASIEEFLNDNSDMEFREENGKVVLTDSDGREYDAVVEWNINPHEPLD